ncbi:hypothetical protein CCACVL1_29759 [Corchorus capsularis]|uniref:Uncharacterized protein n=1 Tax=Corchorus capsularis TaxID=210143 RepID=A0A1R3G092_COCAP|nr:hypothetical protein CCACVL1_29759 [Corchorus capsularis]
MEVAKVALDGGAEEDSYSGERNGGRKRKRGSLFNE